MIPKIFFAAIAEPNTQLLGDFILLLWSEFVVKGDRLLPLSPTGPVIVGIPIGTGNPNTTANLFDEGIPS